MGHLLRFPDPEPVGWRKLLSVFRKTILSTVMVILISPFMLAFAAMLVAACICFSLLLVSNLPDIIRALREWNEDDWDGDDDDDDDDGEPIPIPEEERRLAA